MKKLLILSLVLILFLVGCAVENSNETTWPGEYDPTVPTTLVRPPEPTEQQLFLPEDYVPPVPVITTQYLPAEVENPDNLPVVKWLCLPDYWYAEKTHPWTEDAVLELNDMLAARNMPFRVQFVIVSSDQYDRTTDWYQKPEVQALLSEADLVFGTMTREQMKERLSPITEYICQDGALETAVPHRLYWNTTTVSGETYGIPCTVRNAQSTGWRAAPSLLENACMKPEDLQKSFWEMDELLARIYDANGNKPFLYVGKDNLTYSMNGGAAREFFPSVIRDYLGSYQLVGSCFAIDYSQELPQVVNALELEDVRAYQQAVIRYKKAGYITQDSEKASLEYAFVEADQIYQEVPGGRYRIPVTEPVFIPASAENVTGITNHSAHKVEARDLLELIAKDEAFRMQLLFGQEGQDYILQNGYYQRVVGEDGARYSLDVLSPLAAFCGMKLLPTDYTTVAAFTDSAGIPGETGEEKLQNLRAHLDHSRVCLSVEFDYTGYEEELQLLDWNFRRYYPYYTNHKHYYSEYSDNHRPEMGPAMYELMLEDFREAGSESIQSELQYQLDKWLEENP